MDAGKDIWELLRDPGIDVIDMTAEHITERLRQLRADGQRGLAARLERALEPFLRSQHPRRERKRVAASSYGRALRVELLPRNFYFREEVSCVRQFLGVPADGIGDALSDNMLNEDVLIELGFTTDEISSLRVRTAADRWLRVHRQTKKERGKTAAAVTE